MQTTLNPARRRFGIGGIMAMLLVAVTFLAAPHAQAASDLPFTNDRVGKVYVAGSDTTYFIMSDLATAYNQSEGCRMNPVDYPPVAGEVYNACDGVLSPEPPAQTDVVTTENYDHDVVVNYFPQGSNDGKKLICGQTESGGSKVYPQYPGIQIARSSSSPSSGFQCSGYTGVLRFISFARDGLAPVKWAGGAGSGVANLTLQNLKDIWVNCTVSNWNQVGGANERIRVFTAIPGSGTRTTWDGFMGGSTDRCIPNATDPNALDVNGDGDLDNCRDRDPSDNCARVVREHFVSEVENAEAIGDNDAANQGHSIYYLSVGRHEADEPPGAKGDSILVSVNGVAPTKANVANGTWPLSRLLYNVIRQSGANPNATEETRRFTNSVATATSPNQGWICKPLNMHSKPVGDPGPGIEDPAASKNYAQQIEDIYTKSGFVPLTTDPAVDRCDFTDFNVT